MKTLNRLPQDADTATNHLPCLYPERLALPIGWWRHLGVNIGTKTNLQSTGSSLVRGTKHYFIGSYIEAMCRGTSVVVPPVWCALLCDGSAKALSPQAHIFYIHDSNKPLKGKWWHRLSSVSTCVSPSTLALP